MKIRVLGGGWYGCSITAALADAGHDVELHETAEQLFSGASGSNPGRLHLGPHYPRSELTRQACLSHQEAFMERYGFLTRGVPINIYAIASEQSLVDFGTFSRVLRGQIDVIEIRDPADYGLTNVEGGFLTGERHIVIAAARSHFSEILSDRVKFGMDPGLGDVDAWDLTIDCTFCALDGQNIDRYEPCVTAILQGPVDKAVTIMDGPFPSIYPWDPAQGLCSLTSAKYTPISKDCRSHAEARDILDRQTESDLQIRAYSMRKSIHHYWPGSLDLFDVVGFKMAVRAMPKSASDARLVDVVQISNKVLRIRAGKIDAIFHAEKLVKEHIDRIKVKRHACDQRCRVINRAKADPASA